MPNAIRTGNKGARALFALLLTMMTLTATTLRAQSSCAMTNKAFKSGEKITYELYFNWKFVWVKAGTATLSTKATTHNGVAAYKTDLLSVSSKRVDFFFKMRDTLTSIVTQHLEPIYFRKGAEEGKRYTVDEAWFSKKDGENVVNQKRTYMDGTFVETSYADQRCTFDMLSILAQARSWDASDYTAEGQKINFPMASGKKVEEQTLVYRGKKNIESDDGNTYRCLVFSFVEYNKGKEKEVITFFVSDDDNHLPIRLDMYLNIGSAKAFIKHVENNRYPLSSIVKSKK